jgi:hypothetical protein
MIGRQSAGRNHTMHVRMEQELLIPAVQHAEESDLGAEQPGVASHLEQGFSTGPEQQIEEG